jgi:hypothetical protein
LPIQIWLGFFQLFDLKNPSQIWLGKKDLEFFQNTIQVWLGFFQLFRPSTQKKPSQTLMVFKNSKCVQIADRRPLAHFIIFDRPNVDPESHIVVFTISIR